MEIPNRSATNAFAGATTFAATFVESVAAIKPSAATSRASGPNAAEPRSAVGSPTSINGTGPAPTIVGTPDATVVTATATTENTVMNPARPSACPVAWSFWVFANREKSLMLSAMVAQNPTTADNAGKKCVDANASLAAAAATLAFCRLNISANVPPPVCHAQRNIASVRAHRNGAATRSAVLMLSTPFRTTKSCAKRKTT